MSATTMHQAEISKFRQNLYEEVQDEEERCSPESQSPPRSSSHEEDVKEEDSNHEESDLQIAEDNKSDSSQRDTSSVEPQITKEDASDARETNFTSPSTTADENLLDVQFSRTLHQNMQMLMTSALFADVIVLVQEKRFPAHRIVLASCSGFFYRKLLSAKETSTYQNTPRIVNLEDNVSEIGFKCILQCMYSARVRLDKNHISEIMEASKFLEMPIIAKACLEALGCRQPISIPSDKEESEADSTAIDLSVKKSHLPNENNFCENENKPTMEMPETTHLKKYRNFLSNQMKMKEADLNEYKFPHLKKQEEEEFHRSALLKHLKRYTLPESNRRPNVSQEGLVPQLIAPFTMARAAVLAMASQFHRYPQIAAPTPMMPLSAPTFQSQFGGFRPYTTPPSFNLNIDSSEMKTDEPPRMSSNHNLLMELNRSSFPDRTAHQDAAPSHLPPHSSSTEISPNENSTYTDLTKRPKPKPKSSQSKPYKCLVCSAEFNRPANLKTHMRIHSGEKPYRCDACGARFVQVAHLRAHALIHTGEKPYQCKICGTRFRHLQTLKSHIRIHTGEKPYSCNECKVQFRHKSQLRLHLRTKHGINTNTKKTYQHVPGLRSDDISAHIRRTQEMIRVNQQMNRTVNNDVINYSNNEEAMQQ